MIIFDLDGTLANCEHRRHFIDPEKDIHCLKWFDVENGKERWGYGYKNGVFQKFIHDWKSFNDLCEKDTPIASVVSVFGQLCETSYNQISIWSGRCESQRKKTLKWLHDYVPRSSWLKELKMRPIGDNTPDDVLKERWLDEHIGGVRNPIDMVFDDRPKVIRMWRRRGIFVFNCCQHDEEF